MVWIDQVLSADATHCHCSLVLDPDSAAFGKSGLRQSSLIEWMAQGFGFAHASQLECNSSKAYLVTMKDIEYCPRNEWDDFCRGIKTGDQAFITVDTLKTLGGLTVLKGEVKSQLGLVLARGSFKVFVEYSR